MTANAILQAACEQFAVKGFEGASLAGIAQAVGIRKQSIATYYPRKEDLFMAAFHEMARHYYDFLEQLYHQISDNPVEMKLREIVYRNYYYKLEQPVLTAFYKMAVQFPPPFFKELLEEQIALMEQRSAKLYRAIFEQGMSTGVIRQQQADSLLPAFYCLLDGIAMQMFFYGQEEFERRLADIWEIFWAGIKQS
ncbi:TetR/AcrR family transcriptional regulator [Paenibacillus sp. MMS20-IR301]|uniref:TetR/AcrR family transcriptional regulator n=1 Tax=Paenibacillus sp. MMS20-IR301 TaxID=2895946 RepID=UPI0028EC34FE|nr:TetR/AcrR family transcriptional regulator [Paenibacillus sp. MMS20-IR301]WNS45410.1 TetR/AcrR family transcriptional regulator [Paenibacillus sp. MMS20-IR301]